MSDAEDNNISRVYDKVEDIVYSQLGMKLPPRSPPMLEVKSIPDPNWKLTSQESSDSGLSLEDNPSDESTCKILIRKLENVLREAKSKYLQCGEVLLPHDLTWRIAQNINILSENEPCGLRGCLVYINLEEKSGLKRIGKITGDPDAVATFELILTLRQDKSSWVSLRHLIPNKLLQSLGRRTTMVLSNNYTMEKKKLYRSTTLTPS